MNVPQREVGNLARFTAGTRLVVGCACVLCVCGCDEQLNQGGSVRSNGQTMQSSARSRSPNDSLRDAGIITSTRAKSFLDSLVHLSSDDIQQKLKDPDTLRLLLDLSPEEFLKWSDGAGIRGNESASNETIIAGNLLWKEYYRALAREKPMVLKTFIEEGRSDEIGRPALFLAEQHPEVAFSTLEEIIKKRESGRWSAETLAMQIVCAEIVRANPELAIRLINDSSLQNADAMQGAITGFLSGFNIQNHTPADVADLISKFSSEKLCAYPNLGGITCRYDNCPPNEVLAAFPLDGQPWQRYGAITYLEAAAYKGANGDTYVTEFLNSPQASALTDQEKARLLHILRK